MAAKMLYTLPMAMLRYRLASTPAQRRISLSYTPGVGTQKSDSPGRHYRYYEIGEQVEGCSIHRYCTFILEELEKGIVNGIRWRLRWPVGHMNLGLLREAPDG